MNKGDVMQEVIDKVVEEPKTPIVPVAPVQTVSKKPIWFLISVIILLGISLTYLSYLFLGSDKEIVKYNPTENKVISVETPESEGIKEDPMKDWKTYDGKDFSFRYPNAWTEEKGANKYERGRVENIDVVNLRISENAVFQASHVNKRIQQILQDNSGAKKKNIVGGLEATSIETVGVGDALPEGYSVLLFAVMATEDTSYQIIFNGDRKDFSDNLVDQILSTFEFVDSNNSSRQVLLPGQKRYTSEKLGVEFLYMGKIDTDEILTKEIGNKVYVYTANSDPKTGQYIEVIDKDPSKSLNQTLQDDFLTTQEFRQNCKVTKNSLSVGNGVEYPKTFEKGNIEVAKEVNNIEDLLPLLKNCPSPYTQSNRISYFLYDSSHPSRYAFVSIGQYAISADDNNLTWQDTIRFSN